MYISLYHNYIIYTHVHIFLPYTHPHPHLHTHTHTRTHIHMRIYTLKGYRFILGGMKKRNKHSRSAKSQFFFLSIIFGYYFGACYKYVLGVIKKKNWHFQSAHIVIFFGDDFYAGYGCVLSGRKRRNLHCWGAKNICGKQISPRRNSFCRCLCKRVLVYDYMSFIHVCVRMTLSFV